MKIVVGGSVKGEFSVIRCLWIGGHANIFYLRLTLFSVITQVIIEILALSLAENGVIFHYNHLWRGDYSRRTNFQMTASHFLDVSEEQINL